ncbi:MAG: NusG domain II-containing protein [Clostridiales bacterium]|nr:NusG domain II-containing protein [Clostridiales bacterium]
MKKSDLILILLLILAAGWLYFSGLLRPGNDGGEVVIYVEDKEFARIPLHEDQILEIPTEDGNVNTLQIKDGMADMISADCKDQICVNQKAISKKNETIICLPHKIVVEIQGDAQNNDIDMIAN